MTKRRRQRKRRRALIPSLITFSFTLINSIQPCHVLGFTLKPFMESFSRSKNERQNGAPRTHHRRPCQEHDWTFRNRESHVYMVNKKELSSDSLLEKPDSETFDIVDSDDAQPLDDWFHDDAYVTVSTSEVPFNSSLPVISLDNIDLLVESSTTNIAYFYLKNEIGMTEEAMWKITLDAGQVLGMTADTLRRKVDLIRRTLNLSDDNVRILLERQPTILQLSADQNLAPTILFLQRALDLSKADLRSIVVQFPCVLCYSIKNLKSKLNFFQRLLGFSQDECRKLLVGEPKLLTASVTTGLLPHLRFYTSDLDIPVDKLRTIIQKNPRVLLYSIEDNLVPKLIFYLTMNLRVDSKQMLRLLTKYPQLLDYNLNDHILPITAYLMQEIEYSPTEVRQILLSFPRIMTHSLRKIKHVVGYLRFELGLEAAQVKRVLYQAPQVIGLNTDDNLKKKVAFLQDEFSLTRNELRRVISGMPTLLICSIEHNLQPKTDYLRTVFQNKRDLHDAILTLPGLLGYSLEKRIKPRMERLLEIGGHPKGITIGIPMKDEAFDQWLGRREKRLEKNPGFDDKARSQGAASLNNKEAAIVHVDNKNREEKNGRITHWTRERRPPPQQSN